jgi:hypothetical protein
MYVGSLSSASGALTITSGLYGYTGGTTGSNIMSLVGNWLTTGKILNLASSSNSMTGTLLSSVYSGSSSGKNVVISTSNASASGDTLTVSNSGTGNTVVFTSGSSNTVITSGGNVGIGTSSPSSALDISGAANLNGIAAPAVSSASQGRIYYDRTANKFKVSQNGAAYVDLISAAATSGFLNGGNAFGANASLGTTDNKSLSFFTNNSTAMTISQGGNVGFGTTDPGAPVDINHASYPLASTNGILAVSSNDAYGIDKGGTLSFGGNVSAGTSMYSFAIMGGFKENSTSGNTAGYLAFGTPANGSLPAERMRITSAGNVGIGTATPNALLDVNGTMRVSTICDSTGANCKTVSGGWASGSGTVINSGHGSPSGILHIQSNTGSGRTIGFAQNVTAGNLLIVVAQAEGSVDPITVTDTLGTSYVKAVALTGNAVNQAIYYGTALSSGANTVSANQATSYARMAVSEFSGLQAVVDATASVYNGSATASLNITTATAGDLLFATVSGYHSSNTFTAGPGYFLASQSNGADANGIEYRMVGAAGIYSASMLIGGAGADNTPFNVVAFRPTSATSPGANGDFYFDLDTLTFYGPRTSGVYPTLGSLGAGSSLNFPLLASPIGTAGAPAYSFSGNGNTGLFSPATNIAAIATNGSERWRIDASGNVGIGTTSPQTTLQVAGVISPATNNTYTLGNATYRFTEVYATNGVINTSDRREKKDIYNTDLGLDFINKLRPVSYRWNTGVDNDVHYGLIAQEAEQVIAEVGKTEKTSIVTHDETTDRYGVRYSELISPLIKAVQELYNKFLGVDREIASIKADNAAKDQKIEKLEKENTAKAKEMADLKARLDKIEKALKSK